MSDYIKREDALFVAYQQPFSSVVTQIKMLDGIDIGGNKHLTEQTDVTDINVGKNEEQTEREGE